MIQEQNIPIERNGAKGYWCNGLNLFVSFPLKLYIAESKNEMHNDKKLNSIPSHIVLKEESFISPIPNEFTPKIL